MTAKTMLANAGHAAARLRQRAQLLTTMSLSADRAETIALIEEAAAIEQLLATWTPPGADAQIACEVQALARRQLAAMRIPAEHVRQLTKGKAS